MKSKNKVIIILSIIMLVFAALFLIIGFILSGYDIIGWFGSKYAIWFYVILGTYALIVGGILITERIKKL